MQIDEEYFQSDEFQEILDEYESAMDAGHPPFMDVDDLVDIADYYTWIGEDDEADDAIEYALELYPGSTLPNVYRARQAIQNGNTDEAMIFAEDIEDKDDPDFHYLIAEIMIAENNCDGADKYLREYGKKVDPDEYEDFVRDCANLFIDYGASDVAYQWMMRSRGDNSDDFKELMARTLFGLGKYKDSERLFNELIDSNPYSKNYWNALASAQLMNEEYSEAVSSSEYAIAIDPYDADALNQKASGLFRMGNYEEALKYFQRYYELAPTDEYGLLHQGICLVNLGRPEEALPVLRQALDYAAEDSVYLVEIYQELAFCHGILHQPDEALQMLDKTETLPCDHADAMVIRGHILLQNGRIAEAEDAFKQAIERSDSSPNILLRIIVSLYDNHLVKVCYDMLRQFFRVKDEYYPDYNAGYAYMALCCHDLGLKDEFMYYLELAAQNNPREAQSVLGFLFPEDTPTDQYVDYMKRRLDTR